MIIFSKRRFRATLLLPATSSLPFAGDSFWMICDRIPVLVLKTKTRNHARVFDKSKDEAELPRQHHFMGVDYVSIYGKHVGICSGLEFAGLQGYAAMPFLLERNGF